MTEKLQPVSKLPTFKSSLKVEEKKPATIIEQLEEMNNKIDTMQGVSKKGKVKPYKLKYQVRTKLKRLAKKRKILVLVLENNRSANFQVVDTKEGIIVINGVPRPCGEWFVYLLDGKWPMVVLPEYSTEPIGTKEYQDKVKEGNLPTPTNARLIYAYSKVSEIVAKKSMGNKAVIFIGIGVIVALYLIFGGSLG